MASADLEQSVESAILTVLNGLDSYIFTTTQILESKDV
jgi:hypothetical protein